MTPSAVGATGDSEQRGDVRRFTEKERERISLGAVVRVNPGVEVGIASGS